MFVALSERVLEISVELPIIFDDFYQVFMGPFDIQTSCKFSNSNHFPTFLSTRT